MLSVLILVRPLRRILNCLFSSVFFSQISFEGLMRMSSASLICVFSEVIKIEMLFKYSRACAIRTYSPRAQKKKTTTTTTNIEPPEKASVHTILHSLRIQKCSLWRAHLKSCGSHAGFIGCVRTQGESAKTSNLRIQKYRHTLGYSSLQAPHL